MKQEKEMKEKEEEHLSVDSRYLIILPALFLFLHYGCEIVSVRSAAAQLWPENALSFLKESS